MALNRVWIPSPHYSSRGGASVRLIVIHTAEGARTIESLGSWFQQPGANCSSHVGADDKANTVGEYVHRPDKAWTQSEFNPVAVSLELCGFAAWTTAEWDQHPNMLDNCARWIAEESAHWNVPITRLTPGEAQGSGRGVCQHVDLGSRGGGHHDCGSGFPMDRVLEAARSGGGTAPTIQEDENMVAAGVADDGTMHVWWAGTDRQTVWFRYQRKGSTEWVNGGVFTKAAEKISGLASTLSAGGALELFARYDNGDPVHCWQSKGKTSWSGGEAGKQIAGFTPLPK